SVAQPTPDALGRRRDAPDDGPTERRGPLRGHPSRGPYPEARSSGRSARGRRRRTRHLDARGEPHRRRHVDLPRGRLVRPFCPGERAGDHIALGVLYLLYSVPAGTEPGTPPGPVGIPEPDLVFPQGLEETLLSLRNMVQAARQMR